MDHCSIQFYQGMLLIHQHPFLDNTYKNVDLLTGLHSNTTIPKFYKIDDRKYLVVDSKIVSEDYSIEANNYLLVELDKAGNAKLSNLTLLFPFNLPPITEKRMLL